MSTPHLISSDHISIPFVEQLLESQASIELSKESIEKIKTCREYLNKKINSTDDPVYGINTGFGSLYNKHIGKEDLKKLQVNLVKSHACGTGDEIPDSIVQLMLLFKIQSLAYGHSGVQVNTVQRLIDFYNKGIYPIIYEFGSLGASGDLAPLAHLSLPLIGLGEVKPIQTGSEMAESVAEVRSQGDGHLASGQRRPRVTVTETFPTGVGRVTSGLCTVTVTCSTLASSRTSSAVRSATRSMRSQRSPVALRTTASASSP